MFLTGLGIGGQSFQVGMNYSGDSAARGMSGNFGGDSSPQKLRQAHNPAGAQEIDRLVLLCDRHCC